MNHVKPSQHGRPVSVGVLGGGRMGAGIAHAFCAVGAEVVVLERTAHAAESARQRIVDSLRRSADRGPIGEPWENAARRLRIGIDYSDFADCALVVEAVPEDLELKSAALAAVEGHLAAEAMLATNTSSLSIDQLARGLRRPERFCGLHFFNPVPVSTLVEVVLPHGADPQLEADARGWVGMLGKTAVAVRDSPGFATSRLGVLLALEAMRMLEEGVAAPEDIDAAMVQGYRHATGPLRTTDLVGLDVRLGIAEYLQATLGDRFAPPKVLREKVARGELGRKSGKGFYDWGSHE